VLAQARARVRDRENLRFERTRVFGRARRIFLEIGARLAANRDLENARDVFLLEVGELIGLVEGTATITDLPGLVRLRRAEFEHFKTLPAPPRRFSTQGPIRAGTGLNFETAVQAGNGQANDHSRNGIACSPGVIRGPVRVVLDPRNANLTGPSIIVAERTDPGWILILPLARALLVERGSLLSHSAIVSRELGIPAIVAIPGVTSWLKDGDWVELDGSSGTVKRIDPDSIEPATLNPLEPHRE
jgi:rifampicin phosphotransferase